jgi:hypothetical protein
MSADPKQVQVTLGLTRKSLEGVIIHACPWCEAPGVFMGDERTRLSWPGCWQEGARGQTPVGSVCPNCGNQRRRNRNLGELTASMPRWLWSCVLGFKWCVIKVITVKRKIGARRYGNSVHRSEPSR